MSSRLKAMVALVGALVALSPGVVAATPRSAPAAAPPPAAPADGLGEITARTAPDMFEALQRDLDLTRAEALARIEREGVQHLRHAELTDTLGDAYAGAWLDEDAATLTVAVSNPEVVPAVRAAGARPQLVAHPLEQLEDAQAQLRAAPAPAEGVAGWFVDHEGNRLVVQHRPGRQQAARDLVTAAGVDPQLVRFDVDGREELPIIDIDAGDEFARPPVRPQDNGRSRLCSTGFGVRPLFAPDGITGFVTAGHCAPPGTNVQDSSAGFANLGRVVQTTFDLTQAGPDRAWVRLDAFTYRATPFVNGYGRPTVPVVGSQTALPGAAVCASGRSSFFRCGRVVQLGVDRMLADLSGDGTRVVTATTETTVCSDRGDSGGPLIDDRMQAQGIAVSAVINCATNPSGPTFFQPINPILFDFNLELLVTRPDPPAPPPAISSLYCSSYGGYQFSCDVTWTGGVDDEFVSWGSNGFYGGVSTDPANNTSTFHGNCVSYDDTWVFVEVIDALGRRSSDLRNSICDRYQ